MKKLKDYNMPQTYLPMEFDALTKIDGDPIRHIEQLWDEVKTLKYKVTILEAENKVFRKLLENKE